MKITAKPEWKSKLHSYGKVSNETIYRNGKKLAAVSVSPTQKTIQGTVIFAHPLSRKAKYFFTDGSRIKHYLNAGYRVLLFDFNGFGESDRIDLYFWKDTAAVIAWVQQHFHQPIIIHGTSFGSFHCIRALPTLPSGSKVVLENTNRSLLDYWKHWPHTALAVRILQNKLYAPGFIRDMNVIEVFKHLDRPDINYLFITCSNDKFTPRNEMEELAQYLRGAKTFLHTQNTQHLEAPVVAENDYRQALLTLMGT